MSDVAAVRLGEWFLTDSPKRSNRAFVEILRGDPPLALWVGLKADRLLSAPPQNLADLAVVLAEHGLAWLQWEADRAAEVDETLIQDLASRAALAVLVSELAAELAAVHGEAVRSQAQLIGLFQDPAGWWAMLPQSTSEPVELQPPSWLSAGHFHPNAFRAVEQAVGKLGLSPASSGHVGVPPASSASECASPVSGANENVPSILTGISPQFLGRVLDAASRWAATHQAARWLSPLMANLAKLSLLERSFREEVEAEKIAAMAEFAAGAGHEINNPLAVIAGRAQLLLRDEIDPERRRDLALMNAQAMRVNEMIADLRLFATPPELELQTLDLTALVRRLIEDVSPLAAAQETRMALVAGPSPLPVDADPVQLTVALRALCQNALDALGHRGQLEIVLARDGEEASITVADDGPGILPEQRSHIFEPFYSARQAGRGVGMGLSKCWRIVTRHGGRIEVGGRAGSGAVFMIRLPLRAGGSVGWGE
jgi:signal transduction histidine kinase